MIQVGTHMWWVGFIIGFIAIWLVGCDKEVAREPYGDWTENRSLTCTVRTYDCSHLTTDADGDLHFESETCTEYGHQPGVVKVNRWKSRYKSGAEKYWDTEQIVERRGGCAR